MHVQASMELGPEDVPLLERCPHFRAYVTCMYIPLVSSVNIVSSDRVLGR